MKDPVYILTSIEGIPIILKCVEQEHVERYTNTRKKIMILGKACAERNINSNHWTDETNSDKIARIINRAVPPTGGVYCWIQKEDAFL